MVELDTRFPLETPIGVKSDHLTVYASFEIKHIHMFTKKKFTTRPRTKKGEKTFARLITLVNWSPVLLDSNVNKKVRLMNEILTNITEQSFPEKTFTIKSSDAPWITRELRRMIRKRKRRLKKYGRDEVWRRLKREIEQKIEEEKKKWFERQKEAALLKRDSASYYRAVNDIKMVKPPPLSILDQ